MRYRSPLFLAFSALLLNGCATNQQDTLPQPATDTQRVWQTQMGQGNASLAPQSGAVHRLSPAALASAQSDYARDSWRETTNVFPRLPNPDIVMYVLPHRAGALPVPGYSTVFPLYERVHYATPMESPANLPKEHF
ncbi:hypothetical protein BS333_21360 (plasmid) [Vibrio azureus]|uniref:Conjugal transfer protein n=1 Tax=Vibrio azureus NBRC 104587 TaxID=1219077 RepID=U3ASH0_9VIBR|nr:TIGR03751 family conjugal transfer lipoprotein [Vibrio azureus]AUI88931.1 hypothetical protein BS333_21360 [Vibrio azureus]GAD76197.1 hypothetical protein VAZ01S_039_00220 [Vibrio azureus NBRC 104587]